MNEKKNKKIFKIFAISVILLITIALLPAIKSHFQSNDTEKQENEQNYEVVGENMEKDKLLPIGSVVILKEAKKRVMIIGRIQKSQGEIFDYSSCLYPEGYIKSDQLILFNNSDIDKIFFVGFQDEEEVEFYKKIEEFKKNSQNV